MSLTSPPISHEAPVTGSDKMGRYIAVGLRTVVWLQFFLSWNFQSTKFDEFHLSYAYILQVKNDKASKLSCICKKKKKKEEEF